MKVKLGGQNFVLELIYMIETLINVTELYSGLCDVRSLGSLAIS